MRSSLPCAFLASVLSASADAQEKARTFCDESHCRHECPGMDCCCVPDTLEVTFDGRSGSVLHAGDLEPGATITVTVVTATKSEHVSGWSYGVAHDESVLKVLSATTEATDAKMSLRSNFAAVASIDKIEMCVDQDPRCAAVRDGGGWISATLLSLTEWGELPVKRNSLAVAEYMLLARPGPEGTTIEFSNRLKKVNSPPVALHFTIAGRSRIPTTLIDGFITPEASPVAGPFLRGDANGDSRINVTDGIGILLAVLSRDELACGDAFDTDDSGNIDFIDGLILLRFLFDRGPAGSIGICGMDSTADLLDCPGSSCR